MNLNLYDKDLNRISAIGVNFVSCLWSEGYNVAQDFTIELRAVPEYKEKIKPDCYVGRTDRKTLMVIKSVQSVDNRIIASGKQATRVLDDVAFIGTIPENSVIDTSVKNAYNNSSGFYNLTFSETDLGVRYDSQISNKSFLELCETMCQASDLGFRVIRDNGGLLAEFYKPTLATNTKLAEKFGNVRLDSLILSTENEKNYAIVLGGGEEENRVRVDVDMTGGEDRREVIVDARDLQQEENETIASYQARLKARGIETLLSYQKTWECSFFPLAEKFGKTYDLGDVVLVILSDYGIKLEARITRFTQKEQLNQTETTLEVGSITIR